MRITYDAVAVALADSDAVRIPGQLVGFEYEIVEPGTSADLTVKSVSGTDERPSPSARLKYKQQKIHNSTRIGSS